MPEPQPCLKVLELLTRMNIGGPARHVVQLARDLEGFDVRVAAGRPGADEGELTDPDVPVTPVPLVRPVRPATDLSALRSVRRLVTVWRPDILHTHMAKAGTVGRLAALTVRPRPRPRTVHTFHGHVLEGYFSPAVTRSILATERFLARHTDVLVAVSTEVRDELLALGIGRPNQYRIVPVGIDVDAFATPPATDGELRKHLGLTPDVPLVGVLARLVPIKDHATLFRAMAEVDGAHLAVLGDGELRGDLEQLAATLGITDRIHFTGWWPDVAGALADLDVVALTSRNEGTPVALMEAAAAGVPVVATDVGGVRGVVDDGRTGCLAAPGASEAVAAHLGRLLGDAGLRQTVRTAARQHAGRFDEAAAVAGVANVYRVLAGDARR